MMIEMMITRNGHRRTTSTNQYQRRVAKQLRHADKQFCIERAEMNLYSFWTLDVVNEE